MSYVFFFIDDIDHAGKNIILEFKIRKRLLIANLFISAVKHKKKTSRNKITFAHSQRVFRKIYGIIIIRKSLYRNTQMFRNASH